MLMSPMAVYCSVSPKQESRARSSDISRRSGNWGPALPLEGERYKGQGQQYRRLSSWTPPVKIRQENLLPDQVG